ncbi:KAP family P-loop NTPase fold protein [Sphingobacterium suaedae]|uniref:P-loop NTPase fold protein n=1 Tax=Sphingobacterium suaedae TaxID=1686402 RepID=A0ABW5KJM6_9SPHI
MDQLFNSDKPIHSKDYDRFDRYKFANRIAETIAKRNTQDGLVVGLYGIWGEGKSSVLNMIENDLVTKNDILLVKFNPWRFKDEDTLILNFFKNLSSVLDRELNSQKELIGKILKDYGNITSILGLDLTKVGETMSDASLDTLKGRVNKFLQESSKKVVIIIDDIDRLDKQELFALFKLIKLTADFTKTYYILSFDDDMVASAIGERYAEGNKSAGHNFLEKIIQVPLRIPQALPNSLLNYTFELLNDILRINNIDLKEKSSEVGYQISKNIILRIKTPRLAIRYANSLAFLIPLLSGEVNISDLILFEGLKLFYPQFYDFIKHNPEYFIESYENIYKRGTDDKKKEGRVGKGNFTPNLSQHRA